MPHLQAIAYISASVGTLSPATLDAILLDARSFNESVGVTGVLLHNHGSFFQYFEGAPSGVAEVYARIRKASQHAGLFELYNQPISTREFAQWDMGFCEAPRSTLQELANESWSSALEQIGGRKPSSPGLSMLLSYLGSGTTNAGNDLPSELDAVAG